MIGVYAYGGTDFHTAFVSGDWKIGLLRYSERFAKPGVWERHLQTDEVFVLLSGAASLYERQKETIHFVTWSQTRFTASQRAFGITLLSLRMRPSWWWKTAILQKKIHRKSRDAEAASGKG